MSNDINARYKLYEEAPSCCKTCPLLDFHGEVDEKRGQLVSCSKDIRLPVRKNSCNVKTSLMEKNDAN